jgi:diacylglycerol kinase (ATP)
MKIGLVYNQDAGRADSLGDLTALLARHGHEVAAVAHPADGVAGWADLGLDFVAAAGGDGTIAGTACAVAAAGLRVPLAIVPIGTANNIAASLGVPGEADAAIDAWPTLARRALDIGTATGSWGERRFVESVGGGVVTHGMTVMDRRDDVEPTPAAQIRTARRVHAEILDLLEPAAWQGTVDGETIAGEFLLLEILNTAAVGPRLRLADASPFDGLFTIVGITASERAALRAWIGGDGPLPRLVTWHGRDIELVASDRLHVDDAIVDRADELPVRVRMDAGAVAVLAAAAETPSPPRLDGEHGSTRPRDSASHHALPVQAHCQSTR